MDKIVTLSAGAIRASVLAKLGIKPSDGLYWELADDPERVARDIAFDHPEICRQLITRLLSGAYVIEIPPAFKHQFE